MSFRLFIYYCAVYGGWGALAGWGLSRIVPGGEMGRAALQGMGLGMTIALGVGLADALWVLTLKQPLQVALRVVVALVAGGLAGFLGGWIGMGLYRQAEQPVYLIIGWGLTGLLIGGSLGLCDLLSCLWHKERLSGAIKKIINGLVGGLMGGILGGALFLLLRNVFSRAFGKPADELLSSSAIGFVALGFCIGLLIGIARVVLKEAWLRVEAGFRPGREMLINKAETLIGKGEQCDVGLYGGKGVEKTHARIVQLNGEYLLEDAGTPAGTYLNDQRIVGPMTLKSGDLILVGNCALLFQERRRTRRHGRA